MDGWGKDSGKGNGTFWTWSPPELQLFKNPKNNFISPNKSLPFHEDLFWLNEIEETLRPMYQCTPPPQKIGLFLKIFPLSYSKIFLIFNFFLYFKFFLNIFIIHILGFLKKIIKMLKPGKFFKKDGVLLVHPLEKTQPDQPQTLWRRIPPPGIAFKFFFLHQHSFEIPRILAALK